MDSQAMGWLSDLSPAGLVVIIAGLFYMLKEVWALLKARVEAKELKANGAGSAKTGSPTTILLEEIRDSLKHTRANEVHVRAAVEVMRQTQGQATEAAAEAKKGRELAQDIHEAHLGPAARTEDGGLKWLNPPSVSEATLETRDNVKVMVSKLDELILAVRQHGCPYLDRDSQGLPEREGRPET